MNIVVPAGLKTGNYQLVLTVAGETSNPAQVSVTQ
jgi:uncharacterized protein (TIGR03437 family)